MVAGFAAVLQFFLHVRVAYWYTNAGTDSVERHVRQYALYNIGMNLCEIAAWSVGTFYLPEDSQYRWAVFLVGILFSMRVPRAFLANDFHGKPLSIFHTVSICVLF